MIQLDSRRQLITREQQSKRKPTLHFSTTMHGNGDYPASGIVDMWVLIQMKGHWMEEEEYWCGTLGGKITKDC